MKKKVFSFKNHPSSPPIWQTLLVWIALDHFHAPGVVQGVVWTIMAIVWASAIYGLVNEDQVDIFEKGSK